jgi:transcriptional regulator with XRE-family HTH domain
MVDTRFDETRAALRAWRKARNKTLLDFATDCGFKSPSIVSEWEAGSRAPSFAAALRIEGATAGAIPVERWGFDRATARRPAPAKAAA